MLSQSGITSIFNALSCKMSMCQYMVVNACSFCIKNSNIKQQVLSFLNHILEISFHILVFSSPSILSFKKIQYNEFKCSFTND